METKITYNLLKYRLAAGLTQKQLSTLSNIAQSTISDMENNHANVTVFVACTLAKTLQIELDDLINYK